MGNRKILIDTSIIIDYLRSQDKQNSKFIDLFKNYELCISVISIFELYNGTTSENKKQDIEIICNEIEVIDFKIVTAKIASNIYVELRNKNKLIEFRDILIGATALQLDIMISTRNIKHFERINNVQILK